MVTKYILKKDNLLLELKLWPYKKNKENQKLCCVPNNY